MLPLTPGQKLDQTRGRHLFVFFSVLILILILFMDGIKEADTANSPR